MSGCRKMILFQVSLIVLASVVLTKAAPTQKESQNTDDFWDWLKEKIENIPQERGQSDENQAPTQWINPEELKQQIQSVIDEWKPKDNGEQKKLRTVQLLQKLAKQLQANGAKIFGRDEEVSNSADIQEFFDEMKEAVTQKIQDLLERVRKILNEATSSNYASSDDDDSSQVEDLINEVIREIRHQVENFLQEMRDTLDDIADSFPEVNREDIEKAIDEIMEDAEKQINEWMKEIEDLLNNAGGSQEVQERIRLFVNQRTSMNNAKISRQDLLESFQSFIEKTRSRPSAIDFNFDFPNATELRDFFKERSSEMRQRFEDFLDTLQDRFDDLRRFNFSDVDFDFDMEDFIKNLVNETRERLDQFLKDIQDAMGNVPDSLKPPSRQEIRDFFNETMHDVCERMRGAIDDVRDYLERIFGDHSDEESTPAQTDDEDENKKRENYGVFMSESDDSLSLAVGHGSEDGGESSNSVGTTAIVLICVGVACGAVVAGVVVRRRSLGRKKMYKHVDSPSAAKLHAASLKASAHSSHEYGTYGEAALKS